LADAPAGIKEVAAHAGVSVGTVSNVLNRPDTVAEPTRSRVRAAIKQPGFIRNESAQLLLDEALGDGTHQHRQVVFEPELVVRQSSQARPRGARRPRRPGQNDGVPGTGPAARNQAG
jgi:DNA-binding LacI/PurR family transcriptional regulator